MDYIPCSKNVKLKKKKKTDIPGVITHARTRSVIPRGLALQYIWLLMTSAGRLLQYILLASATVAVCGYKTVSGLRSPVTCVRFRPQKSKIKKSATAVELHTPAESITGHDGRCTYMYIQRFSV